MTPTATEAVDVAADGEAPENATVCMNNQADEANEDAGGGSDLDADEDQTAEQEAREAGASETGDQGVHAGFSATTGWRNVGETTPQSSEGEEEEVNDDGEPPNYNRDGYDGDLASTGWETTTNAAHEPVIPAAKQQQPLQESVANGGAAVASILNGLTTSVSVEAELQCTLCHEVLCKPVTTPCGHSFCRVCLVEFLLSREVHETQCPICRSLVLPKSIHEGEVDAPVFSINVTLWNVIQLLVPAMREREAKEEDDDYAHKYDQFNAKWRMAALQQAATRDQARPRARHRWGHEDDELDSDDEEMHPEEDEAVDGHSSDDEGDFVPRRRQQERFPELRTENTIDGHLQIMRNVVQDREDANADGYHSMRVGLAIMEFPSVFQLYNEHQECSIAVLKMEEDEDMDGGFPFFTSDDGDDDALIISDYYNQIRLRVLDNAGNVVMERVRGANQGIVTFPALRLDVPGGTYHFQFTDDLYEVCLMVTTGLREPGEENDDLLGDDVDDRRHRGFVLDQAGERGRGRQGRQRAQSDDEDDDDESGSDDSFIVADDEEVGEHGVNQGAFSGSEHGSEGVWVDSDEEEEEAMERLESQRARRQRQLREEHHADDEDDHDHDEDDEENDGEEEEEFSQDQVFDGDESGVGSQFDPDREEHSAPATSRLSRKRARIVDDESDSDDESQGRSAEESVGGGDDADQTVDQDSSVVGENVRGTKRSRAIYESDDDELDEDEESKDSSDRVQVPRGFTSNKRLRHVTSRIFQDDDVEDGDEDEEDGAYRQEDSSASIEVDGGEEDGDEATQSRWVGGDPYDVGRADSHDVPGDHGDASDGSEDDHIIRGSARVQPGEAYFEDDAEQVHSEGSEGSGAEHWDESDVVDDDDIGEDMEEFSD